MLDAFWWVLAFGMHPNALQWHARPDYYKISAGDAVHLRYMQARARRIECPARQGISNTKHATQFVRRFKLKADTCAN